MDYYIEKLKSKIISAYFGDIFLVIVNDYASIKEVFTREEFDGRVTVLETIKDRAFGKQLGNARAITCLYTFYFIYFLAYAQYTIPVSFAYK